MKKITSFCALISAVFFSFSAIDLQKIENELKKVNLEIAAIVQAASQDILDELIKFHENNLQKKSHIAETHYQECTKDCNSTECKKITEEWKSFKQLEETNTKLFEEHIAQKQIFILEKIKEQNPKFDILDDTISKLKHDRNFALIEYIQQNPQRLIEVAKKATNEARTIQALLNKENNLLLKPITEEKIKFQEKNFHEQSLLFQQQNNNELSKEDRKKITKKLKLKKKYYQMMESCFEERKELALLAEKAKTITDMIEKNYDLINYLEILSILQKLEVKQQ